MTFQPSICEQRLELSIVEVVVIRRPTELVGGRVVDPHWRCSGGAAPTGDGTPHGGLPTVTLTVPACATSEAVGAFHKETKDHTWGSATALPEFQEEAKRHAGVRGGFARTPSPRRMAVFQFVAERGEFRDDNFERGNGWRPLMELWNQRLPENHDWHYTDVRNFSRDFRAAKKALFGGRRELRS